MTTAVAIQPNMPQMPMSRPAPIPIAAARPRKQQKPAPGKENVGQGKPVSSTAGPVANIRTRRERPCDACRRRKSRCVIHEGAALCVLCEFHKQECTFVQSPLPRKRKVVDDGKKDSPNNTKKRYVRARLPSVPRSSVGVSAVRVVSSPFHLSSSEALWGIHHVPVLHRSLLAPCRSSDFAMLRVSCVVVKREPRTIG
jgi:hypothetical protein